MSQQKIMFVHQTNKKPSKGPVPEVSYIFGNKKEN